MPISTSSSKITIKNRVFSKSFAFIFSKRRTIRTQTHRVNSHRRQTGKQACFQVVHFSLSSQPEKRANDGRNVAAVTLSPSKRGPYVREPLDSVRSLRLSFLE